MNKLATTLAPILSALTLAFVGALGTGCIVADQTETDEWSVDETAVSADEEALSLPVAKAPSVDQSNGCLCLCNGTYYGPLAESPLMGCRGVCQNFFIANPTYGCGGSDQTPGMGYPVTVSQW